MDCVSSDQLFDPKLAKYEAAVLSMDKNLLLPFVASAICYTPTFSSVAIKNGGFGPAGPSCLRLLKKWKPLFAVTYTRKSSTKLSRGMVASSVRGGLNLLGLLNPDWPDWAVDIFVSLSLFCILLVTAQWLYERRLQSNCPKDSLSREEGSDSSRSAMRPLTAARFRRWVNNMLFSFYLLDPSLLLCLSRISVAVLLCFECAYT